MTLLPKNERMNRTEKSEVGGRGGPDNKGRTACAPGERRSEIVVKNLFFLIISYMLILRLSAMLFDNYIKIILSGSGPLSPLLPTKSTEGLQVFFPCTRKFLEIPLA